MAYPPHALLQWGGRLGSAGEEWSNSLRFAVSGADGAARYASCVALIDEMADAVAAFVGSNIISTSAYLDYVKFNPIGPNGRYEVTTDTVALYGSDVPLGRGTGNQGPFQVTQAVTLQTAASRGLAHQGRFYPPTGGLAVDQETGQITTVVANNLAVAAQALLNACNSADEDDTSSATASAVVVSGVGAGALRTITGIKVGRVPDTQRRRRRDLAEDYTQVYDVVQS